MLAKHGLGLATATAVALATSGLAVWQRWEAASQRQLVARWENGIGELDDRQAAALVRSLRRYDLLAIRPLAAALADKRPLVASAAREALGNFVADWKRLPARESVPRLTALAQELADRYENLSPAEQRFAQQIAQALLMWPLEDADFPADDLVAHCDRILVAPAPVPTTTGDIQVPREAGSPDQDVRPLVTPEVASRPQPELLLEPARSGQDEPLPVEVEPVLISPAQSDPTPTLGPENPRPQPPRQFIRPRVPPIPQPVEP